MKLVQSRICWLLMLFLGLSIVAGIASMAEVQGASNQQFTLTEVDPTGDRVAGWWQYTAQTDTPQDSINSRHDSPWHWRHWDSDKCDDIQDLYPANPNSPDTVISANGQTVTTNIYQARDSVWVCFALECDDGSYSFALMRNLQTEVTVSSNGCGEGSSSDITPPSDTTQSLPPDNNDNGETSNPDNNNGGTINPLLATAEINPDDDQDDEDDDDSDQDNGQDQDDDSDQDNGQDQDSGNTNPPTDDQKTDDTDNDGGWRQGNNAPPPQPKSPVTPPVTQDLGQTAGDNGASDDQNEDEEDEDEDDTSNQKQPRSPYNGPWK